MIYQLSGASWTMQVAPLLSGAAGDQALESVSCSDTADCLAVGTYSNNPSSNVYLPLVLTLASGTWTATQPPVPADAAVTKNAQLDTVSCPVVSYCVAGGFYLKSSTVNVPLLVVDSGTITAIEGPAPRHVLARPFAGGRVIGVSCYAASACTAIGEFTIYAPSGNSSSMILTLAPNGKWTAQGTTRAKRSPYLDGLSCVSSAFCRAVGMNGKAIFESKG